MTKTDLRCDDGHTKPVLGCHACLRMYVEKFHAAVAAAEAFQEASRKKGLMLASAPQTEPSDRALFEKQCCGCTANAALNQQAGVLTVEREETKEERAEFEKWLRTDLRQFQDAIDGLRLADGSYAYPLDNLWRCWQARAALPKPPEGVK